jgi:hypothetical protein
MDFLNRSRLLPSDLTRLAVMLLEEQAEGKAG